MTEQEAEEMTQENQRDGLVLRPIGIVRTAMQVKFDAPHQPEAEGVDTATVELFKHEVDPLCLRDLEGFSWIWIISWFHKNRTWKPLVLPPRGKAKRRGVFATRSPHRPNPIGLTSVRLLEIRGLSLVIGASDLIDGTPVFDVKPYLRTVDCHPEASLGWVQEVEDNSSAGYCVEVTPKAAEQLEWLKSVWQVDFLSRARKLLEQDPTPHRTRRISRSGDGLMRIACGAWRMFYRISDRAVTIEFVRTGYPLTSLLNPGYEAIPDRDAQLEFKARYEPEHS
jgi:tRNA-Thr(GGU) m(6)t(6)A37 methyltransferase TsaA